MCGISGAVGHQDIIQDLYEGIRSLEYRGYDSCGVALMNQSKILVRKNVGGVDEVFQKEHVLRNTSPLGIAHTRWATHGRVTRRNTHPMLSQDKAFAVVHNGIISNHRALRDQLTREGFRFGSETDTEVVPHLVQKFYKQTRNVEKAFVRALALLEGTFALAMISRHQPDMLFCAKRESPLMLGIGDEVKYIGSDFNAFIRRTKNAVILDDEEYAVVTPNSYVVKNILTGTEVTKEITKIEWDNETSRKGGYPHYMLKEIYEQPQTILNALEADEKTLDAVVAQMRNRNTFLVGVGTTYYVAQYAEYVFSTLTRRFVPAISADEFETLSPADSKSLVIAVSQSGETYDTLRAVKHAQARGAKTAAVVNVVGSTLSRLVDRVILQGSGPEICVISTKAALAQMVVLTLLALKLGLKLRTIRKKDFDQSLEDLRRLPEIIGVMLNERSGFVHRMAHQYKNIKHWLYLGRGVYYPVALESALKMKEVAYVHAEGMPCGFLKHGTLAMIDPDIYSVIFVPPSSQRVLYEATMASVAEIRARSGFVLGFHFEERQKNKELFSEELILPKVPPLVAPLLQLVLAQLFAYFTATSLKRTIDKPRSLAKSVTVG